MPRQSYFITGTDTDSGKTVVTAGLLRLAARNGLSTRAMKPLASGCEQTSEGLRNADALALSQGMTESMPYESVNPVALEPAIAPHVAARDAGRRVSVERLAGFCRGAMMRPADLFLVEGAGGWRVPLNDRETWKDLVTDLQLPVILVVGLRLGAINHALLSAELIQHDGCRLAGWVANRCTPESMAREDETFETLCEYMPAPCMGRVPWLASQDPAAMAEEASRYLSLPLRGE
ncbi:dethiobiotin synthase [Vreelandella utahensis]|uniref:dethiobiotin synthase n=1 Tax=Vreelandella halophila TaxID=86177 RepID=UPI000985CFC5|nr:dethiobiotin synthase [Halomonas utahensis]